MGGLADKLFGSKEDRQRRKELDQKRERIARDAYNAGLEKGQSKAAYNEGYSKGKAKGRSRFQGAMQVAEGFSRAGEDYFGLSPTKPRMQPKPKHRKKRRQRQAKREDWLGF